MKHNIEITTSIGIFELVRPKAGVRNRAMIKAETDSGAFKRTVFMTTILPKIINRRPEGCDPDVPIEQLLDSLEIEDYDALVEGCDKLMVVSEDENNGEQKKT